MHEYFGAWAHEPERLLAQWQMVRSIDFARHMAAPQPARPTNVETVPGKSGQSVAVIKIAGTLMKQQSSMGGTSTTQLRRDIRTAANDPSVSGLLLAIDSPGGTVAGTADLADEVSKARRRKPVWAHIDDLGASAAYWVASQADAIFANTHTALIGSIGTVMTFYDESKAAANGGVEVLVFATGPLKGAGTPGSAITEEQRAYFQKMIESSQVHFDAAVKSGRGMTQTQLNAVRTGGVFLASEALSLKLIDGIRPYEKTLAELSAAK